MAEFLLAPALIRLTLRHCEQKTTNGKEVQMKDELTIEDLELLCEALESWENRSLAGEVIGSLMVSIMVKNPEERASIAEMEKKKKAEETEQKKRDKDRSRMLQAKLIGFKDRLAAERLSRGA